MYTYEYPRAAITTDALLFVKMNREIHILLIRRGKQPFKDHWALPGGFVEMSETLEESCIRELKEETGLEVDKLAQFKAYDSIDRDPRGRTISVVYYKEIDRPMAVIADDDAAEAAWHPISNLPLLAFDHLQIINEFFST